MMQIAKSANDNLISLPSSLLRKLRLQEGEMVKTTVEMHTLRLTPLQPFLALRGVLHDDAAFDEALSYLEGAWQSWDLNESA
jgi:antitoxin component of MazEF toxin-antitoxin module